MTGKKDNPQNYPWLGRKLLWLDDMRNVDRIAYGLYGLCAVLFLVDFFYKKKTYFAIEYIWGFYGFYGFLLSSGLVLCAKGMRVFLKRDEDYYAPNDVESEDYPEDQLSRERFDD